MLPLGYAQSTALPTDILLPDASNLALVLNEIEHAGDHSINDLLKRFFPLFERLSIRIFGGTTNIYLFETGAKAPIPAIRLSDGTLYFLALLAALYSPSPPSLLCIDEPELGLHPDAVTLLARVLVEASSRMQLVVTTHSGVARLGAVESPGCDCGLRTPGNLYPTVSAGSRETGQLVGRPPSGRVVGHGCAWSKSVSGVTVYMEGGGPGNTRDLRLGMLKFLGSLRELARSRTLRFRAGSMWFQGKDLEPIPAGSGIGPEQKKPCVLLVDAEGSVGGLPRPHLRKSDGWDLRGVPESVVHLMVQVMETWIVADPKTLAEYYGQGFKPGNLPARPDLEREPKAAILSGLHESTRRTQEGPVRQDQARERTTGVDRPETRASAVSPLQAALR